MRSAFAEVAGGSRIGERARRMAASGAGTSRAVHGAGDALQRRQRGAAGHLSTAYLLIYNVVMTAGWLVIAVVLVREYLAKGTYHGLYYSIEKPLKFFQTGAVLEILHCAVGIVPSSVVLTGFQVMSRVFLTWAVTHGVRERALTAHRTRPLLLRAQVQNEDSVLLFVVAWTVTEIVRYSFYTYTFFIVLYPMGVTGELLTIYASLPHVQRTGLYSLTLPNKYNFSFDYHTFLILTMLYFHMLRQRRKILGRPEQYGKVE
ncbi:very-long-chain (3R)-3-hydroxyacyl-(acyl-carrier protein) dehydratase 2-like [Scleropages formosus]|uniref:Very-long-chain (3R)-3-hydroxyacyl-CoA dehydratase n=1 Tax=Scleropages formosus TaxID=113540 RepID=A0A0P7TS40_SCLFO|nr:very-long-chain (3R)-3-hydroxyacyl-(acyl-carrier protein) dehydratase 2-like [Scleropages formosus]